MAQSDGRKILPASIISLSFSAGKLVMNVIQHAQKLYSSGRNPEEEEEETKEKRTSAWQIIFSYYMNKKTRLEFLKIQRGILDE